MSSKAVYAAVVISVIAIVIAAAAVYSSSSRLKSIENKLGGISSVVSSSSSKIREEISSLAGNFTLKLKSLAATYSNLSGSIERIKSAYQALSSNLTRLSKQLSSLSGTLQSLKNDVAKLNSEVSYLNHTMGFPLEVRDSLNRIVVIPEVPHRIVSIAPSITEILFMIGAGHQVVGVDAYSNYPPIVQKLKENGTLAVVGGFSTISIDKVVSLKPDLVVGVSGVQAKILYTLSQLGLTTLCLDSKSISDVISNILLLGKVTGHFKEALKLAYQIRENLTRIYTLTSREKTKPTILYVVWVNPVFAAGGKSWVNDVIRIAGGENVLANVTSEWPIVSWDKIVEEDPQIIVFIEHAGGLKNAEQAIEWLKSQPYGSKLEAVKTGRVYMLHGELNDIACRPGPRVYYLALTLAEILHPDLFGVKKLPNDLYLENVTSIAAKAVASS